MISQDSPSTKRVDQRVLLGALRGDTGTQPVAVLTHPSPLEPRPAGNPVRSWNVVSSWSLRWIGSVSASVWLSVSGINREPLNRSGSSRTDASGCVTCLG